MGAPHPWHFPDGCLSPSAPTNFTSMQPLKKSKQISRAPSLTLDDGNDTLKVPRGAGRFFTCDDEESEMLSSSYLTEVAEGIICGKRTY